MVISMEPDKHFTRTLGSIVVACLLPGGVPCAAAASASAAAMASFSELCASSAK